MTRITISRGKETVKAKFIDKGGLLAHLEPVYPLSSIITGVAIRTGLDCAYHDTYHPGTECVCKFYCNLHIPAATPDTYMQVLTNEQAYKQGASCEVCHTAMFFSWTDNHILEYLRDKLVQDNDYSEYEIYSHEIINHGSYGCIRYCRLVPGAVEKQYLSEDFDFLDASKDRYYYWPDALEVPLSTIQAEIEKRRTQKAVCTCLEGSGPCGRELSIVCEHCHRPTCTDHARDYTYKLYEEHTVKVCEHCHVQFENEKR